MRAPLAAFCVLGLLSAVSGSPMHYVTPMANRVYVAFHGMMNFISPMSMCTPQGSMSVDQKVARAAMDNDLNHDGVISVTDLLKSVSINHDANGDAMVTEKECVARIMCAFGDNSYVATHVCNMIFGGKAELNIQGIAKETRWQEGMPLSEFKKINRDRYETFVNNSCTDHCLTVWEKVTKNANTIDINKDGIIRGDDLRLLFANAFDADKDGIVTKFEWTTLWICAYGDSAAYARYLWDSFFPGLDSVPAGTNFSPELEAGVPYEDFRADQRKRYYDYFKDFPEADCAPKAHIPPPKAQDPCGTPSCSHGHY